MWRHAFFWGVTIASATEACAQGYRPQRETVGTIGAYLSAKPGGAALKDGEKDAMLAVVRRCWNVGTLTTGAQGTTVVVTVAMARDGRPDNGSIRMLTSAGGSASAAEQAFEAARRAIIRCGASGFDLPVEKYGQWQNIEITFNPENMRIK